VIFDLDGVLTDTASLHEEAWSTSFATLFEAQPDTTPVLSPATTTADWSTASRASTGCATSWPTAASSSRGRAGGRAGHTQHVGGGQPEGRRHRNGWRRKAAAVPSSLELLDELARRESHRRGLSQPALRRGPRTGRHHPARPGAGRRQLGRGDGLREARAGDVPRGRPPPRGRTSERRWSKTPWRGWPGRAGGSASWSASTATMTRPDSSTGVPTWSSPTSGRSCSKAEAQRRTPGTSSSTTPNPPPRACASRSPARQRLPRDEGPAACHRRRGLVPGQLRRRAVQPGHTVLEGRRSKRRAWSTSQLAPRQLPVDGGGGWASPGTIGERHRSRIDLRRGVLRRFLRRHRRLRQHHVGHRAAAGVDGHTAPVRHRSSCSCRQLERHGRAAAASSTAR